MKIAGYFNVNVRNFIISWRDGLVFNVFIYKYRLDSSYVFYISLENNLFFYRIELIRNLKFFKVFLMFIYFLSFWKLEIFV